MLCFKDFVPSVSVHKSAFAFLNTNNRCNSVNKLFIEIARRIIFCIGFRFKSF